VQDCPRNQLVALLAGVQGDLHTQFVENQTIKSARMLCHITEAIRLLRSMPTDTWEGVDWEDTVGNKYAKELEDIYKQIDTSSDLGMKTANAGLRHRMEDFYLNEAARQTGMLLESTEHLPETSPDDLPELPSLDACDNDD